MSQPSTQQISAERWVLAAFPEGSVERSHFQFESESLSLSDIVESDAAAATPQRTTDLKSPSLLTASHTDVIVEVECLALDAFLRTMLNKDAYHESITIGSVFPALGYGIVIWKGSGCSEFSVGDRVTGMLGAATHVRISTGKPGGLRKMMPSPAPLSASLGMLGVVGITAFIGVFKVAKPPQKGETVVVSGAAGATGSMAAQLCKTTGARVIGIAGGASKGRYLVEELGLDGAVDYKDPEQSVADQLKKQCPNGIDFFFDTVGGSILDTVLEQINLFARLIICGAISQYNTGKLGTPGGVRGPSSYLKLAEQSATMQGFSMFNHMSCAPEAVATLTSHYQQGQLKMKEDRTNGIETFPDAFLSMFSGGHIGKKLVDVKVAKI